MKMMQILYNFLLLLFILSRQSEKQLHILIKLSRFSDMFGSYSSFMGDIRGWSREIITVNQFDGPWRDVIVVAMCFSRAMMNPWWRYEDWVIVRNLLHMYEIILALKIFPEASVEFTQTCCIMYVNMNN